MGAYVPYHVNYPLWTAQLDIKLSAQKTKKRWEIL
jgi:hypothetical protein